MNQKSVVKFVGQNGQRSSRFDGLKWAIVILLLIGGIVANTYYNNTAWAIRAACGIVLICIAFFTALQTSAGRTFLIFAKGSRVELRKVVWPTRHETIQTTLVVVAMVVFAALVLWGFDTLFFWMVGWLTGQRG